MKIAYYSVSPTVYSGYGICTRELVYRLLEKHKVDIFAYYGIQTANITLALDGKQGVKSVTIIGGDGTITHPLLPYKQNNYDLIIVHFDAWMLSYMPNYLNKITKPVLWWAIVDHVPTPIPIRKLLDRENVYAVPITKWARERLLKDGISKDKVTEHIYHGIDLDMWHYVKDAQIPGIPEDAEYVVVSVVANFGAREAIPWMIEGFARFLKMTDADAYYYIHTEPIPKQGTAGYNLFEIVEQCERLYNIDLKRRIIFKGTPERVSEETMMHIYSRADVHLITIMGGAFELPILEAAACGTPSITTRFSAMEELVGYDRGIAILPRAYFWNNLSSAMQAVPHAEDIANALAVYYYDEQLRHEHARNMRKWIEKNATWDIVAEKWLKLLDCIEEVISDARKQK